MNKLKHSILVILLLVACCSLAQAQDTAALPSQGTVVDGVAAVVGKNIIKISDVENAFAQMRVSQGMAHAQENRCNILESMLISKLLVHKGQVDSVEVSDDDVETQVDYYLKQYVRQYGSKEAMKAATGYSYDDFHDIYFDLVKDRILTQRVQYNLTDKVKVTPAEVSEFYNSIPKDSVPAVAAEYEVSEIVLQPEVPEAEREAVRIRLAELRERVLKGESFSMLATLYSQDGGSAKKGGELGFFTRGDMVAPFEAAAFALKPGEISPIIESTYGFHIIQLIERRGNSINVRHILLSPKVSPEDMLRARVKLDSIANQIRLGHITFDAAAKQYSTATSAKQGGKAVNANTGNGRFDDATLQTRYPGISFASMDTGEVSNATTVTTDNNESAYQIVRMDKKIPEHQANLNDDYDKLYNAALSKAKNDKVMDWAAKQIKNTYIRIADDYKDCNFRLDWLKK